MLIKYSSNNSGGSWWLKDKDWIALADAGWEVEWGGLYFCGNDRFSFGQRQPGKPDCGKGKECSGHRRFDSAAEMTAEDRWLKSLAREASKECASAHEAIAEFERLTGQEASAAGCNCCGEPHSFTWTDADGGHHYASGDDVLPILYGDGPKSLRDAYRERFDK